MSEKLPAWLRKPAHREEVVASDKGWIVKRTNELLVRVPNLSKRLEEYFGSLVVLSSSTPIPEIPKDPITDVQDKVEVPVITPDTSGSVNLTTQENDKDPKKVEEATPPDATDTINTNVAPEVTVPKKRGRKPKAKVQ